MQFLHFLRSASLGSDWGPKRNKADIADAPTRNYSERDGVLEEGAGGEGHNDGQKHSSSVMGSFLGPRPRSPSPSSGLSQNGPHHPSDVPPSEYNLLQSHEKSKWNPLAITTWTFRYSCVCFVVFIFAMVLPIVLITTLLVLTHHAHRAAANIDFTVDLGYAKYTGTSAADNKIVKWLGIRYAAPPVGTLRFKAPQDPIVNNTVQVANAYGDVCLPTPSTGITPGFSEDCLFLNVYAPVDNSKTRPVFVFIQGGGFNSNSSPNMNGAGLIEAGDHDMIVISFNYRVGPWGFLASKEVKAGGDLNAGLLDQRMVLQWVQKYIHLFGGDPKRVTIGGASAGAASVDLHLTAYGGRNDGLFIAAAAESQSWGAQLTVEESQYQYDGLVERTGCNTAADTLACLRGLDIEVIAKNNALMPTPGGAGGTPVFMYSDVIDGDLIQDYTYNLFSTGRFIKVPSIFGDVTNEGTVFTPKNINNYNDVNNFLKNNFVKLTASQLAQIDHLYPQAEQFPNAGAYWRTAANAYGDMRYMCPGIWVSTIFDKHALSAWVYHWDIAPQSNIDSGLGVVHCDEVNSIWNTATALPESALNPTIQSYWASFIRTQDPNKLKLSSAPEWQRLDSVGLQRMHFVADPTKVAMEAVAADYYSRCNYLTSIGGELGQ